MINLRTVDLNLLPVFEAVYEERSMTRAADRLAMSQPAVSNAVARLRSALRDELFVAGRRGATVTPAADRIYPRVKVALDAVREGFGPTRAFTPGESDRRFTIGTLYAPGLRFAKSLATWLRRDAPRLSWRLVQQDRRDAALASLREGRIDFLADHAAPAARDLDGVLLFRDELVVIAAAGHPRLGASISRREFLAERHATHTSLRMPGNLMHLETALGNRTLDVALEVREPVELPVVVAGTQFIAVCNRRLAESWRPTLKLKILPLPVRTPAIKAYLVWHRSRTHDAGHRWVRDGVARVAGRYA